MLNALVDAVTEAIYEEFGDGYDIHTDIVEQGLTEPCFSVRILKPTTNQFLGRRYFNTNLVAVQYFPQTYGDNAEINDVTERLLECLEYVSVSGVLTRGTDAEPHVEDGVLTVTLDYDYFVIRQGEEEDPFETITVKGGLT
jgi:hypothetical protein